MVRKLDNQVHEVVSKFLKDYPQRQDFYRLAAYQCQDQCQQILKDSGIQHIPSHRAKSPVRLRDKLYQRINDPQKKKEYFSNDDIFNDIRDLAGVRIALYFPGQLEKAVEQLKRRFQVLTEKKFPGDVEKRPSDKYKYRFKGYAARHLIVHMREDYLSGDDKKYVDAFIEIQVASVFMHAYSEVEHDLVYKPFAGELSKTEYSLLDQVNGLAYAAEIGLEQLQKAMIERRSSVDQVFANPYEVGSFIYTVYPDVGDHDALEPVEALLGLLEKLSLNRPKALKKFLENFVPAEGGGSCNADHQICNR